jgi:hypothetical protein
MAEMMEMVRFTLWHFTMAMDNNFLVPTKGEIIYFPQGYYSFFSVQVSDFMIFHGIFQAVDHHKA